VIPEAVGKSNYFTNYFIGNDSNNWITIVPNYREIIYRNIYNGIDLRYYVSELGLKYDFTIHPGGNPEEIMIKVKGSNNILLTGEDDLKIFTNNSYLIDKRPMTYQYFGDEKIEIGSGFKVVGNDMYGFLIEKYYDRDRPLIIDPFLQYSSYVGGSGWEGGLDMIMDKDQNPIIVGVTNSTKFLNSSNNNDLSYDGYSDIFITKINSAGSGLVFSTFIGGQENETEPSIALDKKGNIYITGQTTSYDFPTTNGSYDNTFNDDGDPKTQYNLGDVFVCKLDPLAKSLEFSTFIGGGKFDEGRDITVDSKMNIYVIGTTASTDFPVTDNAIKSNFTGGGDAFILKLENNGSILLNSTFIGGYSREEGCYICFNQDNNVVITGQTDSPNFPTTINAYIPHFFPNRSNEAIFISILDPDLTTILHSTYLFNNYLTVSSLLCDSKNNIIVSGTTVGNDLPTSNNALKKTSTEHDGFITKFNADLTGILYSTLFGGSDRDMLGGATLDINDKIYVLCWTESLNFPITAGAFQVAINGINDITISKIDIDSSIILYSTYFGGMTGYAEYGHAISLDNSGLIYVTGQGGKEFLKVSGASGMNFSGGQSDVFIFRLKPNCKPDVINLTTSKAVSYRSSTITIHSNAFDNGNNEWNLIPKFELLDPEGALWRSDLLSTPFYNNQEWQVTMNIPKDAQLGEYSFRVKYDDQEAGWCDWFYNYNSFRVINRPPELINFNLSTNLIYCNDILNITVKYQDLEDSIQLLTGIILFKESTEEFWMLPNFLKEENTPKSRYYLLQFNKNLTYGFYDFKLRIKDNDGDFSPWYFFNGTLCFLSQQPRVNEITISKTEIYRTESLDVRVSFFDNDSNHNELKTYLQFKAEDNSLWSNLSLEYINDSYCSNLQSLKNWSLTTYSFRTKIIDEQDNESPWFYLNNSLKVLNNEPKLSSINYIPQYIERGKTKAIFIDVEDVEDITSTLKITFEYKESKTANWETDFLSTPYIFNDEWYANIKIPEDAVMGVYSFRAKVTDTDYDSSPYLYVNNSMILNNSVPEALSLIQFDTEIYRNETTKIQVKGFDIETKGELLKCELYYQDPVNIEWKRLDVIYDKFDNLWFTEFLTDKKSILGYYSFKVNFIDESEVYSNTIYANKSLKVKNNLPEISEELKYIEVTNEPLILNLSRFGYDVESQQSDLLWDINLSTINTSLFQIEIKKFGSPEIIIIPGENKYGSDEITIILIDHDGGISKKDDVRIIVNNKKADNNPEELSISKSKLMLYLIIFQIIVLLSICAIYFRYRIRRGRNRKLKEVNVIRKKKKLRIKNNISKEEDKVKESNESKPKILKKGRVIQPKNVEITFEDKPEAEFEIHELQD